MFHLFAGNKCFAATYLNLSENIRLKISEEDHSNITDLKVLTIPIKRSQNLILLEGEIDGLTGNFILDTGAPYLVLNQTYFRDYLMIKSEKEVAGINGGTQAYQSRIKQLNLSGLQYEKISADIIDLSSIENSRQIKVLGLLGTQLFSRYAIFIDLQKNVLTVHLLDKKGDLLSPNAYYENPYLKMPFQYINHVIILNIGIANYRLNFAFDTAAETNVLNYKQPKAILKLLNPINRFNLTGIGGSEFEVLYARINEMQVDTRIFTGNRFLVTNLSKMGKAYGQNIDGMLGYDFYTRGAFAINFVKREFEMYMYSEKGANP